MGVLMDFCVSMNRYPTYPTAAQRDNCPEGYSGVLRGVRSNSETHTRMPLRATGLYEPSRGTAGTCGIHSSACGRPRACRCAFVCAHRAGSRASAAGVTWSNRTLTAPWAARGGHTTVVTAAGAIYVIGGNNGDGTFYADVWVSTDGGTDSRRGWSGGTRWVLGGTQGHAPKLFSRVEGSVRCTHRVPRVLGLGT
jgi:hypothetical protein